MVDFVNLVLPQRAEFTMRRVATDEQSAFVLLALATTDRKHSVRHKLRLEDVRARSFNLQAVVDEMAAEIGAGL